MGCDAPFLRKTEEATDYLSGDGLSIRDAAADKEQHDEAGEDG
jgi:hypothetical protein